MAFDVRAAKEGLMALLSTIDGLQSVFDGAPESYPTMTAVAVTVGRPEIETNRGSQVYRLAVEIVATFGYVVQGQEEQAEDALCDGISDLFDRALRNRVGSVTGNGVTVTAMLNGTVASMDPPIPIAGSDGYAVFAGMEYRTFPISVRVYQDATYG